MPKDISVAELKEKAKELRNLIVDTVEAAKSGHLGGSMSVADILTVLYFKYLNVDPKNPGMEDRDRFILSKGHCALGYIPCLALKGYFPISDLQSFNHFMSPFGMHPDSNKVIGCDVSSGSLGHGLPIGVGICLGAKYLKKSFKTVVVVGDGECNEGSNWEAAMAANHYKLDNLIVIVDRNKLMIDGKTEDVMSLEPLADKFIAFGLETYVVEDGNDIAQLCEALDKAWVAKKPVCIIANTIKGKGISFMEDKVKWHYGALDSDMLKTARDDIAKM